MTMPPPLIAAIALTATIVVLRRAARTSLGARRVLARGVLLASLVGLVLTSCGREVTAPGGESLRLARGVSFLAQFPPAFANLQSVSSLVPFARVRVVFRHADGSVALDTVVDFSSSGPDQVSVSFMLHLSPTAPPSGEPMALTLDYQNAAGETVFHGGPTPLVVVPSLPGSPAPTPVQVPVSYSGTGSNAAGVRIAPRSLTVAAGDNFTFTASAVDASGAVLSNTPMVWSSLDPTVATIANVSAGAGSALLARGPARIVVQLLTGQADTVTLTVQPKLAAIASISGSGQAGAGGATLPQPVVVKTTATDGLPLAGVSVTFAASAGGSVGAATVVTNASGLAQTTWQLAPALGAQSLTATATGLSAPVTFTATSTSGPPAKLAISTQPLDGTAGALLPPVEVKVVDAAGNPTTYSGAVTMALGAAPSGAAVIGTTTVNAAGGIATFSALRIRKAGIGYTFVASAPSLTGVNTAAFNVAAAPGFALAVGGGSGQGGQVGSLLPAPISVLVTDSCGNPAPGATINFSVPAGDGSVSPASAVTGADGTAATRWTLGQTTGFRIMTAAGAGLTPSAINVGASVAPLVQLQFVQQPVSATAGLLISPAITVRALNAAGATDTLFTGSVTVAFQSNVAGATLAGTLTKAAVRGVATFNDLRVRKAGTGYTVGASASGYGSATSAAFNITAGPAATITVASGNAQSGPTSTALTNPIVALVSDSTGNPLSGVTVTWATSGGTVSPGSGLTNASGLASATWTLGPSGGAQSATATVSPLPSATFTVTASAPPSTYSKTWTGATSTDWSTATNWSPAGVPTSSDSTLIPVVTNQPVLSALTSIGKLTVNGGATVNLNGFVLDIYGNVDSQGSITGSTGSFILVQSPVTVSGNFTAPSMFLPGGASLSGNTTITSNSLQMTGYLTTLAFNSHTLTVVGNATMALHMVNANDSLVVTGTFTANSGLSPSATDLTAGTIVVGGDFVQQGMYQTFPARGTHKVVMKGSTAQHIKFFVSTNRFSHFNDLVIDNAAGVSMDSVNYDNGGGSMYGGINEVGRHLTILNGTLTGTRGSYVRIGGTLTDAVGGRVTVPRVYFDSSATPLSSTTTTLSAPKVYFNAPVTAVLGANLTVNGDVTLTGNDTLKLNSHTVNVTGAFSAALCCTYGQVIMNNAADVLNVTGPISLAQYGSAGTFTAGVISAGAGFDGSFMQASGTHKLVLKGLGRNSLSMSSTDSTTGSYLNDLEIANTALDTVAIGASIYVKGMFTKTTSGATVVYQPTGQGRLHVNGINVTQPVSFIRVPLYIVGGGPVTAFGNATFKDDWYYTSDDPGAGGTQMWHLAIIRGGTGSYTFDGLTFDNVTPAPSPPNPRGNPWGFVNVQGPSGLNVNLTTATPSSTLGLAKSIASGGAALSWLP